MVTVLLWLSACRYHVDDDATTPPDDSAVDTSLPTGDAPPNVLVLILDGVRTDEFTSTTASDLTGEAGQDWAAQTWHALAPEATVVRAAVNPGITITAPAHAALVTGRVEPYANFPVSIDLGAGLYRPTVPTIFEEARTQLDLDDDDVLLVANTELIGGVSHSVYPDAGDGATTDELLDPETSAPNVPDDPVVDAVLAHVVASSPRLMLVNLHDVDRAGHYGAGDAYIDGVTLIDGLLPGLWDRLQAQAPEYTRNLLLVVTADHGRHRHEDDDGWHNHGDSCTGCREVPLFVIGGGTAAGAVLDSTVASLDLTSVIADHLGIDLPWGEGVPDTSVFPGFTGTVRSGIQSVATAGSLVVTARFLDDPEARSEVWAGDTRLSTPGTFAAEAPSVVDAGGGFACFRELSLEPVDGFEPWLPRCFSNASGTWEDVGFAATDEGETEQAPFWTAALTERDGGVWAAWPYNPRGAGSAGADGRIGLSVAGWTAAGGWTSIATLATFFPTDAAIASTTSGLVAASGASSNETIGRYSRHIQVAPLTIVDGVPTFGTLAEFDLAELLGRAARVERPALAASGDAVRLAMIGLSDAGGIVAAAESADGGASWSAAVALPDGGAPLPNVSPAWDGSDVVWATLVDGAAKLCRAAPGDATARCVDAGSARVRGFTVSEGVATVVRDAGVGAWETAEIGW